MMKSELNAALATDKQCCAALLAEADTLHSYSFFLKLETERLERKCAQVDEMLHKADGDWNQTLYAMIFRYLGGNRNQEAFLKLARTVNYRMCLRERGSLFTVEALLFGASGLLADDYYDDYAVEVRRTYDYLRNKYSISDSMWSGEWETSRIMPCNKPEQRIAQIAALAANREFMFDTVIHARSADDVRRLFDIETSEYWQRRCRASGNAGASRLGRSKADMLGINVVVPVMFAYAESRCDERLKSCAVELLESIPPEKNSIVSFWSGAGVGISNALESQAVIQLSNEYCAVARCGECRLRTCVSK